ncbi:glycosyltransferase [Paraburkholderia sp. J67]|uniref:glycosyltransferase n=1 Tax=Paraburkholderia sp. J67 TaxID=2805435 RepID=UPI002ABD5E32|nr:glycosyltransferase [Paraburkholderia sp. J67]
MRISIAMATYNGAKYILEQLQSLANQTLLPYELVVTDDGSTDDTLAIVERFAERAPFTVHVSANPQRLNFAGNFLRAASLCTGDWIAFCDQDDVWREDKLERVARAASLPGTSMVVHRIQPVDTELRPVSGRAAECRVRRGDGPERLPPFGYFAGLCTAFDAALLPLMLMRPRFPDAHDHAYEAAHDKWVCSIADAVGAVRYIRESLILYRQHGANTCGVAQHDLEHRWKQSVATGAASYQANADLASQYGATFERLANTPACAPWKAQLERAAVRYRRTHAYLLARARLYSVHGFGSRLALFASLCLRGSYRFNPIRPAHHALLKDLYLVLAQVRDRRVSSSEPEAASLQRKS